MPLPLPHGRRRLRRLLVRGQSRRPDASLREFAEQQAESVAEAQREQFATLTLNTAVELTGAALKRMQVTGGADEQAVAFRDAMRVLFPEAVALVSAARQGFIASVRRDTHKGFSRT